MRLRDINKGLYVAVKYNKETTKQIKKIQLELDLPNRVVSDKMHTTLQYSRKMFHWAVDPLTKQFPATGKLEKWETPSGNVLVMKLSGEAAEYMGQRHRLGIAVGATYDFDEYKPHITLSYDVGVLEFPDNEYTLDLGFNEYKEDLEEDWS